MKDEKDNYTLILILISIIIILIGILIYLIINKENNNQYNNFSNKTTNNINSNVKPIEYIENFKKLIVDEKMINISYSLNKNDDYYYINLYYNGKKLNKDFLIYTQNYKTKIDDFKFLTFKNNQSENYFVIDYSDSDVNGMDTHYVYIFNTIYEFIYQVPLMSNQSLVLNKMYNDYIFNDRVYISNDSIYYLSLNDKKRDQNSDTIDIHHVTFNGNKYNDAIIDSKSGRGIGART